jgi:hypothetical protein
MIRIIILKHMIYLILGLNDLTRSVPKMTVFCLYSKMFYVFFSTVVIHLAQMFEEMKCVVCWFYDGQSFCKVNIFVVVLGSSGFNWH